MSKDNNLMVTVKKADGTFKKVPLSDLKKKKENKIEETDFDSVPTTRSADNPDKKQTQKVSVDRSAILDGYNSGAKEVKKDHIFKDDLFKKEKEVLEVPKLSSKDFKSPLEEDLPEIYHKPGKLTKTTPFNSFVHKPEIKEKVINIQKEVQKEKTVGLSNIVKQKIPMHDVVSKNKIYGPLEEIQNFNLIDLRRLSSDVGESVSRLQQKFTNIKEESIILYLRVLDVWIKSPLHKEYISRISQSLAKGVNLEKILLDSKGINLREIKALTIMNKTLEI